MTEKIPAGFLIPYWGCFMSNFETVSLDAGSFTHPKSLYDKELGCAKLRYRFQNQQRFEKVLWYNELKSGAVYLKPGVLKRQLYTKMYD
jgi:hypothetical protein